MTIKNDIGAKLPDCGYCGKKESARSVANRKFICGQCLIKINKYLKEKEDKENKEFEKIIKEGKSNGIV